MEVGVHLDPLFGFTWDEILGLAEAAEAGGFATVWLSDHLFLGDRSSLDCLDTWTTLSAIAARTTRIRHIEDAPCSPKPLQRPLPIWIGGGKPRMLRIAVKWANAHNVLHWGVPAQLEVVRSTMRELDDLCRASGRDPRSLRRSALVFVIVARTRAELDAAIAEQARSPGPVISWRASGSGPAGEFTSTNEWLAARPWVIAGTPDEVRDALREYAGAGIEHLSIRFAHPHERSMLTLFAADVLPGLQTAARSR